MAVFLATILIHYAATVGTHSVGRREELAVDSQQSAVGPVMEFLKRVERPSASPIRTGKELIRSKQRVQSILEVL